VVVSSVINWKICEISWEIARVDLSSEHRVKHEMESEKGEPPASPSDEASHGEDVLAVGPAALAGEPLVLGERSKYALSQRSD
jgi:hypothetical protein